MNTNAAVSFTFQPPPPPAIKFDITRKLLREKLAEVRDMLLTHQINGGDRNLRMESFCDPVYDGANRCGTAACIGGWVSILLTGREDLASPVMGKLVELDMKMRGISPHGNHFGPLHILFYDFPDTRDYNVPRVAATAIQRYLDGKKNPWPKGVMPDKLRYKRAAHTDRKGL